MLTNEPCKVLPHSFASVAHWYLTQFTNHLFFFNKMNIYLPIYTNYFIIMVTIYINVQFSFINFR